MLGSVAVLIIMQEASDRNTSVWIKEDSQTSVSYRIHKASTPQCRRSSSDSWQCVSTLEMDIIRSVLFGRMWWEGLTFQFAQFRVSSVIGMCKMDLRFCFRFPFQFPVWGGCDAKKKFLSCSSQRQYSFVGRGDAKIAKLWHFDVSSFWAWS